MAQNIDYDYAEQYQKAYIKTLASSCNFMTTDGPTPDRESIDMDIRSNRLSPGQNISIDGEIKVQLKTTHSPKYDDKKKILKYSLKIKNYRDLIGARAIPKYLFVMVIPSDRKCWISRFNKGIFVAGNCYWVNLSKLSPIASQDSVTIDIPLSQVVTAESLTKLLEYSEEGKVYE
ncbi:DUF4365 domain-containing protein [Glaesserella parasuis]|nr:DUF4365 domain-containing protein [Glaesserella parasuis]